MVSSGFPNLPSDARRVNGIFFPQRIPLKIDGTSSSPTVLAKKVIASAYAPSYAVGAKLLEQLGDINLSSRGLNKTAVKIRQELIFERDTQIDEYFLQALPRVWKEPSIPIALACVSIDGGRTQTRKEGGGLGVHEPHWRETKNALFMRTSGVGFSADPHESLPACFSDRKSIYPTTSRE